MAKTVKLGAFVLLMMGLAGCSKTPTVQDVCNTIAEERDRAECVEELTGELAECSNSEDVLKCMGAATNEDGVEACFASCSAVEGGGTDTPSTPTPTSICERLAPPGEVADCAGDVARRLAECTNGADVLACLGAAPNEDGADVCMRMCISAAGGSQ